MSIACRRSLVVCSALALVFAAGCTASGQAAQDPTTSPNTVSASVAQPSSPAQLSPTSASLPSTSASASASIGVTRASPSVADVSTPSSNSTGISTSAGRPGQEELDRAAVEAQWLRFWDVYINSVRTLPDRRRTALSEVAVDPILSDILQSAENFDKQGLDYYGNVHYASRIGLRQLQVKPLRSCAIVRIKATTAQFTWPQARSDPLVRRVTICRSVLCSARTKFGAFSKSNILDNVPC